MPLTMLACGDSVKTSRSGKSELDFMKSQPWVKTAPNLVFLDGTRQLKCSYEQDRSQRGPTASPVTSNAIPRSIPENAISENDFRDNEGPLPPQSTHHRVNSTGHMNMPMSESHGRQQRSADFHQVPMTSTSLAHSHDSLSNTWPYSPSSHWATSPNDGPTDPPSDLPSASDMLVDYLSYNSQLEVLEATTSSGSYATNAKSPESLSGMYLDASVFPVSSKEEAALLRYYVKRLARDFDLSDPRSHFRNVVPQRAATCPLLLNAIYALSARHLSRVGNYDPLVSNRYHQECLKRVIPVLDSSAAILDENLLASTIILRHLEEIEVPLSGFSPSDRQSHLLGSHAFIKAQRHAVENEGLRQAAFWVGLRQEIYVAFVNQRSIAIALEDLNIDRSCEPAADHIWSCRMVALCADVIRYCFGEDDRSTSTYERLSESVKDWNRCKNGSFTPIYFKEADEDSVFPEVWFLNDEIIIGWQHYYIAKLLLSAHDPKVPRLGPGRASALRAIDEEIKDYVRLLCGIAMSNPDVAPNFT